MQLKATKLMENTSNVNKMLEGTIHEELVANVRVRETEHLEGYQLVHCISNRKLSNEFYECEIRILIQQIKEDLIRVEVYS